MSDKEHYAVIDPYKRKLTLTYQGEVVAETERAWILKEIGYSVYDPVFYLPKEDVRVELVPMEDGGGHCPIKGDRTHWNLKEKPAERVFAWSYEEALPESASISGHLAFSTHLVTFISAPLEAG